MVFTDSDALRAANSLSSDMLSFPLIPLFFAISFSSFNDRFTFPISLMVSLDSDALRALTSLSSDVLS